ncbi:MAG: ABC transporter permease [Lachnospiraceae bacterium]|nr:ABC transporter permease [Lachnospiraceae bacterium]
MNNKKIIFKVTAAYMKKNKKRTLITFLGIMIMVAMMTAVFVGKDTVLEYMKNAVAADKGKWHIQVYDVNASQLEKIRALKSTDRVEIARSLGYSEFAQSGNPDETPYIELKGYSGELFDWMNIKVKEGRYPENENEILLSERALKEGSGIAIGDVIEAEMFERYIHAFASEKDEEAIANGEEPGMVFFSSGFRVLHGETLPVPAHFPYYENNDHFEILREMTGEKRSLTVVGFMEMPYYEAEGQGGYIALSGTEASCAEDERVNIVLTIDLHSKQDCFAEILSILDEDRTEEEREAVRKEGCSYMTDDGRSIPVEEGRVVENNMLLTFAARGNDASFNYLCIFFQVFFVALITAAALILIVNVFSMSFRERSRYLGMLSSVGATGKQKKWSVYYEVFSLLLFALPGGILLGLLTVKGGMMLLYPHFSKLISAIASNVINGRSCEIGYRLIVNPVNILFVIVFSTLAVRISAWIPAMKISKVGPVESIRGNEDVRTGKKRYKSRLALLLKGKPERLIAAASLERNRHSTRGIVRSITAFAALSLITAFASRSMVDIIKTKTENEDFMPGERFQGYDYAFATDDDADYAKGKADIESSPETESFRELEYSLFAYNIAMKDLKEEYKNTLRTIVEMYFPEKIPDIVMENVLEPTDTATNPVCNFVYLSPEDYAEVAKNAGADVSGEHTVLVYDTVRLSTDEYRFAFDGALQPDYAVYDLKEMLALAPGEELDLLTNGYDEEEDRVYETQIPVTFAGYVDAEDVSDFFRLRPGYIWIITSTETGQYMDGLLKDGRGILVRSLLFNVNTEDSSLVRRLSQINDTYGDSAITSASMYDGMTDFMTAITRIIEITAGCFTILIALICLLNLYNSVAGRKLSRHRELSVLDSMGMTKGQKQHMLLLEDISLLGRSFLHSVLIVMVFVLVLQKLLSDRFGKLHFTLPLPLIAVTLILSVAGLLLFTALSYRDRGREELIEKLRTESV